MTGIEHFNRPAFHAKAQELEKQGWIVINPATLPLGLRQEQYMDICLAMVRSADYVVMLDGWEQSTGANAEYALAISLGHTIYDESMRLLLPYQVQVIAA